MMLGIVNCLHSAASPSPSRLSPTQGVSDKVERTGDGGDGPGSTTPGPAPVDAGTSELGRLPGRAEPQFLHL